ncbi:MAG: GldG family protein [Planctomycetaceae bacterium]|nr:GldG family protein [Planctomycetaceae bacterium]
MASATLSNNVPNPRTAAPVDALVIVAAGAVAAWLAAGSTGLLGHGLQHALTWLALAVALIAACPKNRGTFGVWATLSGATLLAVLLTSSTVPTLNVLAVAVVLAAIAVVQRGLSSRIVLLGALAAVVLALYRLACDDIPMVWLAADFKGYVFGRLVGGLVGRPLSVGATFGGLDFLLVMTVFYVGWLICTEPPRGARAIWAAVAILACHVVYLTVLAYSETLLAALPDMVLPPESDTSNVGVWTVGNGLRMMLPWNVPLLAVALQVAVLVTMFHSATWKPVIELDEKQLKKLQEEKEKEEVPGAVLLADLVFRLGPPTLAVVAVVLVGLSLGRSDLTGKTVVAYEKGYLNWQKPQYDSSIDGSYGLLPMFVEALGGKFQRSKDLSEKDLAAADVLVLIHPDEPWSEATLQRIWDYVRRGGSLLLAADPMVSDGRSRSSFNDVLQPTSIRVRRDTAVTRTGSWEQSYQVPAHPATVGLDDMKNRFGIELGSSLRVRWPAKPLLVGRWGWSDPGSDAALTGASSYNAGEPLGDLPLAAEQSFGRGRVLVLGNASPLRNEMLANSYPFVGRLLGHLANSSSDPQAVWRELLGLLALLGLIALLVIRPNGWQILLTSAVLSLTLVCVASVGAHASRVLPDGRPHDIVDPNKLAYVDATHLEAFSSDLWTPHGVAGLLKSLMRHGYLPLLATDLSLERLQRAGLLISIAPAREFTGPQRAAIASFVGAGGTFLAIVGAEESRPIGPLLADFDFAVPHSPVPPGDVAEEPSPLGAKYSGFGEGDQQYRFYAAWPIQCNSGNVKPWSVWTDERGERPVIASHSDHGGTVVVIGDTHFASNENYDMNQGAMVTFWRWLLSRVTPGQEPWSPPSTADAASKKSAPAQNDDASKKAAKADASKSPEKSDP